MQYNINGKQMSSKIYDLEDLDLNKKDCKGLKSDKAESGKTHSQNNKTVGLYIHIPFCASKCNYCDFNSHVSTAVEREKYIRALCKDISYWGDRLKKRKIEYNEKYSVDTIFFGGGTPTVLEPKSLVYILNVLKKAFTITSDCEITTECNPGTICEDGLNTLRVGGFNRLSIGMQSADREELLCLGRIHDFDACCQTVNNARNAGFKNISVDLMFGLPGQTMDKWKQTLIEALNLKTEHISAYSLKIEEGTPFARIGVKAADDDLSRELYDFTVEYLKKHGYDRYEISNFALRGYESRHNLKYWNCDEYIGLGCGAASLFDGCRFSNVRDAAEYIDTVEGGKSPSEDLYKLTDFDKMSEFIYLGLRQNNGFSETEFFKRFGKKFDEVFYDGAEKNMKRGTLVRKENRIFIPDKYLYVSSAVMSDFV